MKRPTSLPSLTELRVFRQCAPLWAALLGLFVFLASFQSSNDEWLGEEDAVEVEELALETSDALEEALSWSHALFAALQAKRVCNCHTAHDLAAERRANILPAWVWKASRTEAYCQWQLEC
jgi:hypothetical protein